MTNRRQSFTKCNSGPVRADQLPRARLVNAAAARNLLARVRQRHRNEMRAVRADFLDSYRPDWLLIDQLEAGLPRKVSTLDRLYERSLAVKQDAMRGLVLLLVFAAIARFWG